MKNFKTIADVTSIHNPLDFEGLSGIIEKSEHLQKQKEKKDYTIGNLKEIK